MRCIGRRLSHYRLWLAVVLIPLAIPPLCAAAEHSVGNGQQVLAALPARAHDSSGIDRDGERENPRIATAQRPLGGAGCCSAHGGAGVALKAAWRAGKSHVSRRGAERCAVTSYGHFAAVPLRLMISTGPRTSSPGLLSAEYALLRRLEL